MADPDTVLAYSNVGHTETGYLYTWKWRTGAAPARANDVRARVLGALGELDEPRPFDLCGNQP